MQIKAHTSRPCVFKWMPVILQQVPWSHIRRAKTHTLSNAVQTQWQNVLHSSQILSQRTCCYFFSFSFFCLVLWFARIAQREAFQTRTQTLTLPFTPHNRFKEVPFSFACLSPPQWYTLKSFDQDMQPDSGGEEERQQQEGVENRDGGGRRQRRRERCSTSSTPTHASHETPCSSSSLFIMLQTHTSSQAQTLLGTEFTHHLRIFGIILSPCRVIANVY